MAGPRQPIELIIAKGAKNLTKDEITQRKQTEVQAPADKVRAPAYLTKEQKKEFNKYAKQLKDIGIISNLDCDALARFVIAQSQYLFLNQQANECMAKIEFLSSEIERLTNLDTDQKEIKELRWILSTVQSNFTWALNMQDKQFKQCTKASADLGLTISSRCKLVVPKPPEKEKEEPSVSDKLFGGVV